MKKFFVLLLSVLILSSGISAAEDIDLSGLSFEQLVALRERLNLAIWSSREWQEVTVPAGVWVIGEDIPAGHWSIRVAGENTIVNVSCFNKLNELEKMPARGARHLLEQIASAAYKSPFGDIYQESADFILEDGWYFKCTGTVIFTPFAGKPDLGFK